LFTKTTPNVIVQVRDASPAAVSLPLPLERARPDNHHYRKPAS